MESYFAPSDGKSRQRRVGTPKESHHESFGIAFSSKESNYSMVIDLPLFCWITRVARYSGPSPSSSLRKVEKSVFDACCKAPLLDLIVCYFYDPATG